MPSKIAREFEHFIRSYVLMFEYKWIGGHQRNEQKLLLTFNKDLRKGCYLIV